MAAPTSPRVWAESISSVVVKWAYAGANQIDVYRSTDGAAYTRITIPALAAGTLSYNDTELTAGTKYWYKMSDDNGVTFSTVVTVWTHSCLSPEAGKVFNLPRFDGEQQQADNLNALAERVEQALGSKPENVECFACPSDGAVTVKCTEGCPDMTIIADQDINSISIQDCGDPDDEHDPVKIFIPPSTTRKVCGFPKGWGFSGDECNDVSLSGGTTGRTVGSKGSSTPGPPKRPTRTGGGSGGSGGGGCNCIPGANGELTIKCCTPDCSLNCNSTKTIMLKICGGIPPYTVVSSGDLQIRKRPQNSNTQSITYSKKEAAGRGGVAVYVYPPTNTGSSVTGDAYAKATWHKCNGGFNQTQREERGCNDQQTQAVQQTISNAAFLTAPPACAANLSASDYAIATVDHSNPACSPSCDGCPNPTDPDLQTVCDMRSAPMIAAGCKPCGLMQGTTVTVTDAAGVSVAKVIAA